MNQAEVLLFGITVGVIIVGVPRIIWLLGEIRDLIKDRLPSDL